MIRKIFFVSALTVFLFGGVAYAQTDDLPGPGITPENPFYFIDKFGEAVREFFTFSQEGKARLQVAFAAERIAEIKVVLEAKGVEAGGLDVAEARLREHLSDAAQIVVKQKSKGKDVSVLARELNGELHASRKALKNSFDEQEEALEAREDELEAAIRAARRTRDIAEVERLVEGLGQVKAELELLDLKEDELEDVLEAEEEKLEDEMDAREEAEEEIEDALEEKQDVLDKAAEKGVTLSPAAFARFDSLISRAERAFDADNFEEADGLAEEAERSLEDVEDLIEELEDEIDGDEDEGEDSD